MTTIPATAAARTMTTTTRTQQQRESARRQQQFPPPPPYSPNATVAVDMAQRTRDCRAAAELRKALSDFRSYKRALGTTVFCASYYIIYMLLALLFFRNREVLIAVIILNIICLCAIAGVFGKKGVWLLPMFVLFALTFCLYFGLFLFTIFCLVAEPINWWYRALQLFPITCWLMEYFGVDGYKMTVAISVLALICTFGSSYFVSCIGTSIEGMTRYCRELHNIALNMLGSTTDLKDPNLVKHMQKHLKSRARANRSIV